MSDDETKTAKLTAIPERLDGEMLKAAASLRKVAEEIEAGNCNRVLCMYDLRSDPVLNGEASHNYVAPQKMFVNIGMAAILSARLMSTYVGAKP